MNYVQFTLNLNKQKCGTNPKYLNKNLVEFSPCLRSIKLADKDKLEDISERRRSDESNKCPRVGRKTDHCYQGSGICKCRKCSLISLGDVEPREVHTMIRFIKQNKVYNPDIRLDTCLACLFSIILGIANCFVLKGYHIISTARI